MLKFYYFLLTMEVKNFQKLGNIETPGDSAAY